LPELIDVIIQENARLFVSAVGVPPKEVIDKLHQAGILVMNVSSRLSYSTFLG
jgi:NAD(P)H-dependent flavin oxidoreductase YrpB (nitropropane dioxygenase family)